MPNDWSKEEIEAIVTEYFVMWEKELRGQEFNKAAHNRNLQKLIPRSRGSIEKKHQNISAVLWHLNYPYIDGYKPLPNYQNLLREVIEVRLLNANSLDQLASKAVHAPVKVFPAVKNLKAIQVLPPKRSEIKKLVQEERKKRTAFVQRNYIEDEARNRSLGKSGEEFILQFESERLWREGRRKLAERIEHVSKTKGDYLGYDILSYEANGREKLIEVKTTRYGALTRFFASVNEVRVSHEQKGMYHLFRLYHFEKQPKFFVLSGSLQDTCHLTTVNYSAIPI